MGNPIYVIAYDVGTTGVKTCLFSITDKIELLGAASEGYNLYVYPDELLILSLYILLQK